MTAADRDPFDSQAPAEREHRTAAAARRRSGWDAQGAGWGGQGVSDEMTPEQALAEYLAAKEAHEEANLRSDAARAHEAEMQNQAMEAWRVLDAATKRLAKVLGLELARP